MKKMFLFMAAAMMSVMVMAQEKMVFTVEGPEDVYNRVRINNESSYDSLRVRVVVLDEAENMRSVYGVYEFAGKHDTDSKLARVNRGTKLGIQLPEDFSGELSYSVEYKDYPGFDVVLIHLFDKSNGFKPTF
jgi:hypothetical protein